MLHHRSSVRGALLGTHGPKPSLTAEDGTGVHHR